MAIIYMATNLVTGERYIGCTTKTLTVRAKAHWYRVASDDSGMRFHAAIREYGMEMFRWTALKEVDDVDDAFEEERRIVTLLRPEYNSTDGGRGGTGRIVSEEARELLRELGYARIDVFRQYSHLGPKAMARPVRCLDDGREFESASEAARAYGVSKSMIIELCNGNPRRKTAAGRRFSYVDTLQ